MIITNIEMWDFDETTVEITAVANDNKETFYVQTVDGVHRGDLGCWITTFSSDGDIDSEDYPDFDIEEIIKEAEEFIQSTTIEEWTNHFIDNERVYLITNTSGTHVVTRNNNYINKDASSYQREFSDPIATFDTREEALNYVRGCRIE